MGAAVGALAAEEIIALVLGGTIVVGGVAAAVAFSDVVQHSSCAACAAAPDAVRTSGNVKTTFRIKHREDISALSLVSAVLEGTEVLNKKVPYGFSFVIGKGENPKQPAYHAGILINGDFDVEGNNYPFMFVDRWKDALVVNFYREKRQALERLKSIQVGRVLLTDCNETPTFSSWTTANDMVQFAQEELLRKMDLRSFRSPEDLRKMQLTNCIVFAIRAGILLAAEDTNHFYTACMAAIENWEIAIGYRSQIIESLICSKFEAHKSISDGIIELQIQKNIGR